MAEQLSAEQAKAIETKKAELNKTHKFLACFVAMSAILVPLKASTQFRGTSYIGYIQFGLFFLFGALAILNVSLVKFISEDKPWAQALSIWQTNFIIAIHLAGILFYIFTSLNWLPLLISTFLFTLGIAGMRLENQKPKELKRLQILRPSLSIACWFSGLLILFTWQNDALILIILQYLVFGHLINCLWQDIDRLKVPQPAPAITPSTTIEPTGLFGKSWRPDFNAIALCQWTAAIYFHWSTGLAALAMTAVVWRFHGWIPLLLAGLGIINLLIGEGLYRRRAWAVLLSLVSVPSMLAIAAAIALPAFTLRQSMETHSRYGIGLFLLLFSIFLGLAWRTSTKPAAQSPS